jgi:hypothetical protein
MSLVLVVLPLISVLMLAFVAAPSKAMVMCLETDATWTMPTDDGLDLMMALT